MDCEGKLLGWIVRKSCWNGLRGKVAGMDCLGMFCCRCAVQFKLRVDGSLADGFVPESDWGWGGSAAASSTLTPPQYRPC
jgi:hypothetical protein